MLVHRARSSVAEHAAHNRLVEGSNPSGPTRKMHLWDICLALRGIFFRHAQWACVLVGLFLPPALRAGLSLSPTLRAGSSRKTMRNNSVYVRQPVIELIKGLTQSYGDLVAFIPAEGELGL